MIQYSDLPDSNRVNIQSLNDPCLQPAEINMDVLRLDKIHTIISGNKWFKLKYHLNDAIALQKKGIITFGGAYSNHILALAYACHQFQLRSIGFIRGEAPKEYSHTLRDAQAYGMELKFLSRALYSNETTAQRLHAEYPEYLIVDEGGRGTTGIKGAEEILHLFPANDYSHILCAVGTGTTMIGLINNALPGQQVIGIPVLRIPDFSTSDIARYVSAHASKSNYTFQTGFEFGGYAKKNSELIKFMNELYANQNIPTDWIYTAKLFYAAMSMARQGLFNSGSRILIIHSGGLQGNRSLPTGTLNFDY